jgi:zinc and cadmium transporter
MLYTITAGLLVMLASLSGSIFVSQKVAAWTSRNLKYLISFSTGVVIITALHLITETFEVIPVLLHAIGFMAFGGILVGFISFFIPEYHHHHIHGECEHGHTKKAGAIRILIGDALHNVGDGILLASAFALDIRVGLITTLGVLIHEVLQEIAEFFVLREAGYTTVQALARNFLTAASVFIGIAIVAISATYESLGALILAVSAGIFTTVSIQDLIPTVISHSRADKKYGRYVLLVAAGALLMFILTTVIHV